MDTLPLRRLKGMRLDVETALKARGIKDSAKLLQACKTPKQRSELAQALGVDASMVLELANRADLARIKGIGKVWSDLLENAGVDTVKELAARVPENLQAKLAEVNAQQKICPRTPPLKLVKNWVAQAKRRSGAIEY